MAAARRDGPPMQGLNVFLVKTGTSRYEDALDDQELSALTPHSLKQSLPFRGRLFLAPQRKALPKYFGNALRWGARNNLPLKGRLCFSEWGVNAESSWSSSASSYRLVPVLTRNTFRPCIGGPSRLAAAIT